MKKRLIFGTLCLSLAALTACDNTTERSATEPKQETKQQTEQQKTEKQQPEVKKEQINAVTQEAFASYANNIKGGTFIKDLKLNNTEAEVTFYDSFATYKAANADSTTTEEQYKQYFLTGGAIEKIFVSEPARLLRQFPGLNAIKMTLPFEGKTYSMNLDRDSLNTYIGLKIEDLKTEDQSWQKKFNNPYVYNKAKRAEFFKKFVTVQ
ncbi:hypothetical protein ACFVWC_16400 [Bacillus mycoides]|uniref:hypothetical protein n=1 Tax=Bacillus mycoides TaxID=1405 RepID=UPI0036F1392B